MPIMKKRLIVYSIALALVWAIFVSAILVVMLQTQAHDEQNGAFRGKYQGMAIEGLSVLQQELSKANVRISILEQEKGKPLSAERPPWLNAPREPGTCAEPKEETSIEPESRFTIEEVK